MELAGIQTRRDLALFKQHRQVALFKFLFRKHLVVEKDHRLARYGVNLLGVGVSRGKIGGKVELHIDHGGRGRQGGKQQTDNQQKGTHGRALLKGEIADNTAVIR
jgi:hypothetical protein